MEYSLKFNPQSAKDKVNIDRSGLSEKVIHLLSIIKMNPYQNPPPYEKLSGNLSGKYSRRINAQHRLVYEVFEHARIIKILRMWTHYE